MSTSLRSNDEAEPHDLFEILGRKFFNLLCKGGHVSLISDWQNICDSTFNVDELQRLVQLGCDVVTAEDGETATASTTTSSAPTAQKPSHATRSTRASVGQMPPPVSLSPAEIRKKKEFMQPIQVIVDDSAAEMEVDNQPSTSSSIISSQADTQQDAKVYTRIGELRSAGLWSATRLPMCAEPPRPKLHWDFFLEEVVYMANDFRQERLFKRRLARKLCSEAKHYWRKKFDSTKDEKARSEKEAKRVCAAVAKIVREFWVNVDKVVDFRTKEILESQKRKALDQHLSFLVGEADKLSTLLHERLGDSPEPMPKANVATTSTPASKRSDGRDSSSRCSDRSAGSKPSARSSRRRSTDVKSEPHDDDGGSDFEEPNSSGDDDETTIAYEEKHANRTNVTAELTELSQMADLDDDDFFSSLPPGYLEKFYRTALTNDNTAKGEEDGGDDGRPSSSSFSSKSVDVTAANDGVQDEQEDYHESMDTTDGTEVQPTDDAKPAAERSDGVIMEDEPPDLKKVVFSNLKSHNQEIRRRELNNIAEVASEFQPKGNTLETTQVKTEVPFLIRGNLREYQLVGLDWLVTLYEKNLNGILADEMGLGKTIQTVALLAHLACEKMIWGPHLIIVPTSVILNWEMEFKKWCPALKILTYFGSAKERAEKRKGWTKNNVYHVCITSYKIASQDIKALKSKAWQYMILDEAQNIKNFKSQRWQTLLNIRSRRRLLLTGTPLQNSLMELWSLLHFLMPSVFESHEDFKDWFSNPMNNMVEGNIDVDKALVQRLHKVLRPFILRRLKSEVERQLPTKQEKVIPCPLSKRQRYLYNEFLSRKDTRDNLQSGNMMSVLNVIMQLRKCCNHPNLFEPRPVVSPLVIAETFGLAAPRQTLIDSLRLANNDCNDERPSCVTLAAATVGAMNDWLAFERVSDPDLLKRLADGKDDTPTFPTDLPKLHGLKFCANNASNGGVAYFKCLPNVVAIGESNALHDSANKGINNGNSKLNLRGLLKSGSNRKRPATVVSAEDGDDSAKRSTNMPLRKRACRFENVCAEFRRRRQEEIRQIGVWLTELHRAAGAPALAVETVQLLRQMFNDRGNSRNGRRALSRRSRRALITLSTSFWPNESYSGFVAAHTTMTPSSSSKLVLTRCVTADGGKEDDGLFGRACEMISNGMDEWIRASLRSFVLYVSKILCEGPHFDVRLSAYDRHVGVVCEETLRRVYTRSQDDEQAERIRIAHRLQFPELRLIEYDCGKLQTLSKLLKQLYENKHRCLIFTQMSRMLDILQAFLSYYSYKYFRLDGATHIDQRQAMMERFNNDSSIFCFILSTRSGGVGINLTGADTVIFYDSDWNPTMDAQAQDRCHRIGQTRNVTIYRLISEKTIEENILKKANQKRRLGEMALDEAEFTPQFFRSADNIRELFSNEESVVEIVAPFAAGAKPESIEHAMASAEDETDVLAARQAQAEAHVDIAEFDECGRVTQAPLPSSSSQRPSSKISTAGGDGTAVTAVTSSSKYLNEIENASGQYIELISSMTPVERYAIAFLENEYRPELEEEVKEAEALIEARKEDYLKKSDADLMDVDVENVASVGGRRIKFLEHDTYDDDLLKEAFSYDFNIESIPLWMPPSPPNSEAGDLADIGQTLLDDRLLSLWSHEYDGGEFALYEPFLIPESRLPPLPPTPLPAASAASGLLRQGGGGLASLPSTHHFQRNKHSGDRLTAAHRDRHGSPAVATDRYPRDSKSLKSRSVASNDVTKKARRREERRQIDALRRSQTPVYASQSPSPRSSTPGFDAVMINELNSVAAAVATARTDGPQKIDESIERVRRNSTQRTSGNSAAGQQLKLTSAPLSLYVPAAGPSGKRREILYYPQSAAAASGPSTVPPFSRGIGANGELIPSHGGFAMPVPRLHETADVEQGALWHVEEDHRLLTAVLVHTMLTPTMLSESCLELNWEYVAHYVNIGSYFYRSPRACFHRYQIVYLEQSKLAPGSDSARMLERGLLRNIAAFARFHPNAVISHYYQHNGHGGPTDGQRRFQPTAGPPTRVIFVDQVQRERQNTAEVYRRVRALTDATAATRALGFGPMQVLMRRSLSRPSTVTTPAVTVAAGSTGDNGG